MGICLSFNCLFVFREGFAAVLQTLVDRLADSWLAICLLAAFSFLLLSLPSEWLDRLDTRLFFKINRRDRHVRWIDRGMWAITQLGSGAGLLGIALILMLNRQGGLAKLVVIASLSMTLVVEFMKRLTGRVRPYLHLEDTRIIGRHERNKSFPSGHTSSAFLLAVLLRQALSAGVTASSGLFLLAGLVGFSRIYIGMHYPRDVAAGAVMGSLWGMAMIILAVA
jgi:membrane-associated phospholipid phosphatase